MALFDLYQATCPAGPVEFTSVDFGYGALRDLGLEGGIGLKMLRLTVGGQAAGPDNAPRLTDPLSDHAVMHPSIENHISPAPVSKKAVLPGSPLSASRHYVIRYPSNSDNPVDTTVLEIGCGGDNGIVVRYCRPFLSPVHIGGLVVDYIVSQSKLPIPQFPHDRAVTDELEPAALLEFDIALRKFIADLEHGPQASN
jgi:hypothetical protein